MLGCEGLQEAGEGVVVVEGGQVANEDQFPLRSGQGNVESPAVGEDARRLLGREKRG